MRAELKEAEELKRERKWDALKRWNVLQETITWAEAQSTVRRNTPADRIEEQKRKLLIIGSSLRRRVARE